jgi:hypothetical protein
MSLCLVAPALSGCSDDGKTGTEAADESGTGTETGGNNEGSEASGDGDGDPTTTGDGDGDPTGDGDGDPTTGDGDGDGDPTTGDGDGDPTTGDGDGDPTTGDGDGDPACIPVDDTACAQCTASNCCMEIGACEANEDCSCFTTCIAGGDNSQTCAQMCMVNPMMITELMALRACTMTNCNVECQG